MAFLKRVSNLTIACSVERARSAFNCRTAWAGGRGISGTGSDASGTADAAAASAGKVYRKDPLDTSFSDPHAAFKSKTTWEVLRAYVVYTLCSSNYLVEHNMEVTVVNRFITLSGTLSTIILGFANRVAHGF